MTLTQTVTDASTKVERPAARVYLLDDHRIFLDVLRHYLRDVEGVSVVGAGRRGPEAYQQVRVLQPDVVVVDPGPQLEDIAVVVARLREAAPHAALIVLSLSYDDNYGAVAHHAGVDAYIDKLSAADDLITALYRVTGRG